MSITFHIKKEGITGNLAIPNQQIGSQELTKLLSDSLKIPQKDLILTNPITGQRFSQHQTLKNKYSVNVERIYRSEKKQQIAGIVSNEQLHEMTSKARYFMIKSSNEQNVQKARDHSQWATTFANQDKLRSAFLYTPHIFLLFATNRSYQLKGLARMEKQPSKIPDKGLWSGVSNIRLGGNFEIKWIRKKPITSLQIEKALGPLIKDKIVRLSDGEEIDGQIAQKIAHLFQVPTQPYYEFEQKDENSYKQPQKKIPKLGDILGSSKEVPINFPVPFIPVLPNQASKPEGNQKIQEKKQQKQKKQQKSKKKRHRSISSSSSDSSSNSSSRSSDSSSSSSYERRISKKKKSRKQKRRQRSRDNKESKRKDKKRKDRKSKDKRSRRKKQKRH